MNSDYISIIDIDTDHILEQSEYKLEYKPQLTKGTWSSALDEALLDFVSLNDDSSWYKFTRHMKSKHILFTRNQVFQRWHRVIKPGLKKGRWSEIENQTLLTVMKSSAKQTWKHVGLQIGRSDVSVRFHSQHIKDWLLQNGASEYFFK